MLERSRHFASSNEPAVHPELDGPAILAILHAHDVRFVMIGGLAAVIHGSPLPTVDLDITPEATPDNLGRLSTALEVLGARIRAAGVDGGLPFDHDARSLADASIWNLITSHGELDIAFVPAGTRGYADLDDDAETMDIGGVPTRVASLADVIRSKQAANRPKDQRVLPVLREILAAHHQRGGGRHGPAQHG